MSARFEVVRTDAEQPWHVRFVGANNRVVFHGENYKRKDSALRAIDSLARLFSPTSQVWVSNLRVGDERSIDIRYGSRGHEDFTTAHRLPVVLVDERTEP